jgi:hypothetical protein
MTDEAIEKLIRLKKEVKNPPPKHFKLSEVQKKRDFMANLIKKNLDKNFDIREKRPGIYQCRATELGLRLKVHECKLN